MVRHNSFSTRTSDGIVDTRGTVAGSVGLLAGSDTNATYTGATIRTFSGTTQFNEVNRFGNSGGGGGLVTFDYDLTGVVNPDGNWALSINYSNYKAGSGTAPDAAQFYISYNDGASLFLDVADVSLNPTFGAGSIVGDATRYTQLGSIPGGSQTGSVFFDITSEIEAAQANGGGVRLAYVNNNFRASIHFLDESGIITTVIPEPATLGLFGLVGALLISFRRRLMR